MNSAPDTLNHIAIPLGFPDDIQDFFVGILGFAEKYRFEIEKEAAFSIFKIDRQTSVSVLEKNGLKLELFHTGELHNPGFAHICLNVDSIGDICRQAKNAGYPVVRIDRPSEKLAFITDRTGNLFEIKEE